MGQINKTLLGEEDVAKGYVPLTQLRQTGDTVSGVTINPLKPLIVRYITNNTTAADVITATDISLTRVVALYNRDNRSEGIKLYGYSVNAPSGTDIAGANGGSWRELSIGGVQRVLFDGLSVEQRNSLRSKEVSQFFLYQKGNAAPPPPVANTGSFNFDTLVVTPPAGWVTQENTLPNDLRATYSVIGYASKDAGEANPETTTIAYGTPNLLHQEAGVIDAIFKNSPSSPLNIPSTTMYPPQGWYTTPEEAIANGDPIDDLYMVIAKRAAGTALYTYTTPSILGNGTTNVKELTVRNRSYLKPSIPTSGRFNFSNNQITALTNGWMAGGSTGVGTLFDSLGTVIRNNRVVADLDLDIAFTEPVISDENITLFDIRILTNAGGDISQIPVDLDTDFAVPTNGTLTYSAYRALVDRPQGYTSDVALLVRRYKGGDTGFKVAAKGVDIRIGVLYSNTAFSAKDYVVNSNVRHTNAGITITNDELSASPLGQDKAVLFYKNDTTANYKAYPRAFALGAYIGAAASITLYRSSSPPPAKPTVNDGYPDGWFDTDNGLSHPIYETIGRRTGVDAEFTFSEPVTTSVELLSVPVFNRNLYFGPNVEFAIDTDPDLQASYVPPSNPATVYSENPAFNFGNARPVFVTKQETGSLRIITKKGITADYALMVRSNPMLARYFMDNVVVFGATVDNPASSTWFKITGNYMLPDNSPATNQSAFYICPQAPFLDPLNSAVLYVPFSYLPNVSNNRDIFIPASDQIHGGTLQGVGNFSMAINGNLRSYSDLITYTTAYLERTNSQSVAAAPQGSFSYSPSSNPQDSDYRVTLPSVGTKQWTVNRPNPTWPTPALYSSDFIIQLKFGDENKMIQGSTPRHINITSFSVCYWIVHPTAQSGLELSSQFSGRRDALVPNIGQVSETSLNERQALLSSTANTNIYKTVLPPLVGNSFIYEVEMQATNETTTYTISGTDYPRNYKLIGINARQIHP